MTDVMCGFSRRAAHLWGHKHKGIKHFDLLLPQLSMIVNRGISGWYSWLVKQRKVPLSQINDFVHAAAVGAAFRVLLNLIVYPRCYWFAITAGSCAANNDPYRF